jgi:multiple sugar transport system permease protein
LLALLLNTQIQCRGFFRAVFFLPVIVSGSVTTILWRQMLGYETGLINGVLNALGLAQIPWINNPHLAMPAIAIMVTWKQVGFYVVLFLIGLQSIPGYLYEAADLDGAGQVQKFLRITLPSLRNTLVLIVVLSTIGGFSLFVEPFVMTGGGPMNSTISVMLYIYKQAFVFGHMGYAAALGFFFALIILAVVLVQKRVIENRDGG